MAAWVLKLFMRARVTSCRPRLAEQQFEEAPAVFHRQEGFGSDQAHAGPQPPVQDDPDRPGKGGPPGVFIGGKIFVSGDVRLFQGLDLGVTDHPGLPGYDLVVIVGKGIDDDGGKPRLGHFDDEFRKTARVRVGHVHLSWVDAGRF